MTIGKVTKKDTRCFARTYKFAKRTDNLTLKDFAELIEFMNESDDGGSSGGHPAAPARQDNRPILGLGHFLNQRNQASRINNQASRPNTQASRLSNPAPRLNNPAPRLNTQVTRLNNQPPAPPAPRQRTTITYKRNEWSAPPEPEKKKDELPARRLLPLQPPGGRVTVEYVEQ